MLISANNNIGLVDMLCLSLYGRLRQSAIVSATALCRWHHIRLQDFQGLAGATHLDWESLSKASLVLKPALHVCLQSPPSISGHRRISDKFERISVKGPAAV